MRAYSFILVTQEKFLFPTEMQQIQNILLIRTDRLGDVVLSLPLLPVLKHNFPDAKVTMLLRTYTAEIVEGNPFLDDILLYDDGKEQITFSQILNTIRSKKFDVTIVIYPTARLALLVFLAGIPVRVGTGYRWYSVLFNKKAFEHRKDAKRHEVEYNLNLLKALDCQIPETPEFYIDISPQAFERVTQLKNEFEIRDDDTVVILHPGSGGSARDWSARHFGELGKKIVEELHAKILITGSRGEEALGQAVFREIPRNAFNVVGQLHLKELSALIKTSDLFISNSTGPLHIAAVVGTPVIGFYPPIVQCLPERWGPYTKTRTIFVPDRNFCNRCRGGECQTSDCMEEITVEDVFTAVKEMLRRYASSPRFHQGKGSALHAQKYSP